MLFKEVYMTDLSREEALEILGFVEHAKPSSDEIKKAYKKMAFKTHPDRNHTKDAKEKFQKVVQAYEVLTSPPKNDVPTFKPFYPQNSNNRWGNFFKEMFRDFDNLKTKNAHKPYYQFTYTYSDTINNTSVDSLNRNSLAFETLDEFVNILKNFPKNLNATTLMFSITPPLPLSFTQQLKSNHFNVIYNTLINSSKIIDISYPNSFFSQTQRDNLSLHVTLNLMNKRAYEQKVEHNLRYVKNAGMALGAAIGFYSALSFGVLYVLFRTLVGGYVGKYLSSWIFNLREDYLNFTAGDYDNIEIIKIIRDPEVKEKLKMGVEAAQSWPAWLNSFRYAKAYNPIFGAGYQLAMQGNKEVVNVIKNFKKKS